MSGAAATSRIRALYLLKAVRASAIETSLSPRTGLLARDLPEFATAVTEITTLWSDQIADDSAGRGTNCRARPASRRTASCRSDYGADASADPGAKSGHCVVAQGQPRSPTKMHGHT